MTKSPSPSQNGLSGFKPHTPDFTILVALACAASLAALYGASLLSSRIIAPESFDSWFDADVPRAFNDMCFRQYGHDRSNVHPLFVLIMFPWVNALHELLPLSYLACARLVMAQVAALWISAIFITLRLLGCRRLDAVLFSLLAASSASAMFWFVVPETYAAGSLTMALALATVAASKHRERSAWWHVVISAGALTMTVTNWMAGILAAFCSFPVRRALQITASALILVIMLWAVQKYFFPQTRFFIGGHKTEARYIRPAEAGGAGKVLLSFFFHSVIMPRIEEKENFFGSGRTAMITQNSLPGSGSAWGVAAVFLWLALLGMGGAGAFAQRGQNRFRNALVFVLAGQLLLHLLYGMETFLYSAHFGPLLILLAAFSTLTRARALALALCAALLVSAGINNAKQFKIAAGYYDKPVPQQRAPKPEPFAAVIDLTQSFVDENAPAKNSGR